MRFKVEPQKTLKPFRSIQMSKKSKNAATATETAADAPLVSTAADAAKTRAVNSAIINGRMPVAVVAQIRFGKNKGDATKALADMYGTTVGKIDDIKKGRNFAYVGADFKPTAAMIEEGVAWLQRHPKFSTGSVDAIITELETTTVATEAEAAAFEAARVAGRGQSMTTKTGEVANAGGGNRRKARGAKAEAAPAATEAAGATPDVTADALLA